MNIVLKQKLRILKESRQFPNDEYERQQYDRAASDIERILDKMAEKAACEQLENERIRELNEVAQSISYGNIHKGVNIRINRISAVEDDLIEQYDIIAPQLINISRQLQKSLVKQLKEQNRGGKQTERIHSKLSKNDGYWESYWETVSEVGHEIVSEYLKNNNPTEHIESSKKNNEVILDEENCSLLCPFCRSYVAPSAALTYIDMKVPRFCPNCGKELHY